MPNRKQRRRREKDFRHDVRVYEVDEEGNEVPIAELRAQDDRAAKPKAKRSRRRRAASARACAARRDPPSWDRAFKRGGMMGVLMIVVLYFLQGPVGSAFGDRLRRDVRAADVLARPHEVPHGPEARRPGRPAAKKR